MCVERRLVATRFPQNLQRALPGEMWTRCIYLQNMGNTPAARQARVRDGIAQLPRSAFGHTNFELSWWPHRSR